MFLNVYKCISLISFSATLFFKYVLTSHFLSKFWRIPNYYFISAIYILAIEQHFLNIIKLQHTLNYRLVSALYVLYRNFYFSKKIIINLRKTKSSIFSINRHKVENQNRSSCSFEGQNDNK